MMLLSFYNIAIFYQEKNIKKWMNTVYQYSRQFDVEICVELQSIWPLKCGSGSIKYEFRIQIIVGTGNTRVSEDFLFNIILLSIQG